MMNNELVSIIMPAYNAEKYIEEAIESVIEQTYETWELIVVDDASTDGTVAVVQECATKDSRINLIRLSKNGGVANARNVAIENAKGRFLAFLDSDDLWVRQKLEKQIRFMQKNDYVFTYHAYASFENDIKKCKVRKVPLKVDYNVYLRGNSTGSCLTTIVDRNIIKNICMPNEKHEDYICWLNILKEYDITAYGMQECLGYYRIGKKSVSSNKLKSAWWHWKVLRGQGLDIFTSIYDFCCYVFYGIKKRGM